MTNRGIYFNQFNEYTNRWEEKYKFSQTSAANNKAFCDVAKLEERTVNRNTIKGKLDALREQDVLEEEKSDLESCKQKEESTEEESKTNTQILVRPDGSRVLLIKVMVAGMERNMSLKLSEPTEMYNDSHTQEQESVKDSEGKNLDVADMAEEMVNGEIK